MPFKLFSTMPRKPMTSSCWLQRLLLARCCGQAPIYRTRKVGAVAACYLSHARSMTLLF